MDLLELKTGWDLLQKDFVYNDRVKEAKIFDSITSRSRSELAQVKRGLHLKFWVSSCAIVIGLILALLVAINPRYNPLDFFFSTGEAILFFLVMVIAVAVMLSYNYRAYIKLRSAENSSHNLKDGLRGFIDAMQRAITFNIYSDAIMSPLIFLWIYYGYAFNGHDLALNLRTMLLIIVPPMIGFASYYFQRYLQKLKFGQYLARLTDYYNSLREPTSEL